MVIGAIIPNAGGLPLRLGLLEMARNAEAAGAESLWVSDHLLMVDRDSRDYPYSGDGRPGWNVDADYFEAFVCCAMMAAVTVRCRVGTAILVLPQRNVLEVAKVAASLDQLSGGRLLLGLGAGWYRFEFEALGYSYERRGARFDEMIDVLRSCWTTRPDAFDGREVTIPPGVVLNPAPAQPHGPPLLIGGMTGPALRRAAMRGDGWMALAFARTWDADDLRQHLGRLAGLRDEAGKSNAFTTVLKLHAAATDAHALPTMVLQARDLGFDEVMVEPPWDLGIEAACETLVAVREVASGSTGG
jgi:probable F420-dependent oxidoreductase